VTQNADGSAELCDSGWMIKGTNVTGWCVLSLSSAAQAAWPR
jgi:hypothetical protein